jgi:hypothetical protein
MAKAAKKSTTRSSSTPIQQMIRRHRQTFREMDRLYALNGDGAFDGPEYEAVANEASDLENRILNTPAESPADVTAKRRFICDVGFFDDHGYLGRLMGMILQLDGAAVGPITASEPEIQITAAAA